MPYVDVKPNDPDWASIQRIGVTGILRGVGKAEGWANKTYFYPDSIANMTEFYSGLFSYTRLMLPTRWMRVGPQNIRDFFTRLKKLKPYVFTKEFQQVNTIEGFQLLWSKYGLNNFDKDRLITRREVAVIFDKCMVMFVNKNFPMDHNGRLNFKFSDL